MTVGIDITSVRRFREIMARYPTAEERFFTEPERIHCRSHPDPAIHFAGTFAAKEAVIKALGLGPIRAWARRIEITRDDDGAPSARVLDPDLDEPVKLSISHDAGAAVAVAIRTAAVARDAAAAPAAARFAQDHARPRREPITSGGGSRGPVSNDNVRRFLGARREPAPLRTPLTTFSEAARGSDFP